MPQQQHITKFAKEILQLVTENILIESKLFFVTILLLHFLNSVEP
jgi:hypothetical protein